MRRCFVLLVLFTGFVPRLLVAQAYGWCGYALLDGLPLLAGQLSVLEALTPRRSERSKPDELFQYRFSLNHSKVIVEGCWGTYPTQDLIVSLLSQVIAYDPKVMAPELDKIDFGKGPVTEADVVRLYIDDHLVYTVFEGNRAESAARARAYLAKDSQEWEEPDE